MISRFPLYWVRRKTKRISSICANWSDSSWLSLITRQPTLTGVWLPCWVELVGIATVIEF